MSKPVFWLRVIQLTMGAVFSAALFAGAYILLLKGVSELAALGMMFSGTVTFVVPILSKTIVTKGRLDVVGVASLTGSAGIGRSGSLSSRQLLFPNRLWPAELA